VNLSEDLVDREGWNTLSVKVDGVIESRSGSTERKSALSG